MLIDMFAYAEVLPSANEVESHPFNQKAEMLEFCKVYDIVLFAYAPLASPWFKAMGVHKVPYLWDNPVFKGIAEKKKCTVV